MKLVKKIGGSLMPLNLNLFQSFISSAMKNPLPFISEDTELPKLHGFAEAMFPAGEKIKSASSQQMLPQVKEFIEKTPWIRTPFLLSIWLFDIYCLFMHRRPFRDLSDQQKKELLESLSTHKFFLQVFRILNFPFKAIYLTNTENIEAAGCKYGLDQKPVTETARWQSQHMTAEDCGEDYELEADVVVLGSGAGGAAAAYKLASEGHAVVIIEEGSFFTREDFDGRVLEIFEKMYRANGLTFTLGNTPVMIPIGKTVGGTTTINSGTCFRTPDEVLKQWQSQGLENITTENLKPFFEETEQMIGVEYAEDKYIGEIGKIIAEGAAKIGFEHYGPLKRNAPGCDGQALCQLGCPTDAKRSANVSFIPAALDSGAFLFSHFKAEQILKQNNEITGVVARSTEKVDGQYIHLKVNASKVIVAMGSMFTPSFLEKNGIKNDNLGKNLSIHPTGAVAALFKNRDLQNQKSIPQGYGIEDLHHQGVMFEGATLPMLTYGLFNTETGSEFVKRIENYNNTAFFGFLVKDTSRGIIRFNAFDNYPIVNYDMNENDFNRYKNALATLARIYLEAGADEVYIYCNTGHIIIKNHEQVKEFTKKNYKPSDFPITAWHPLGSARMGRSKKDGVVDQNHKVFDFKGLYIMDGSVVPSSLGVNPQVTIMSMSLRAASLLSAELHK